MRLDSYAGIVYNVLDREQGRGGDALAVILDSAMLLKC